MWEVTKMNLNRLTSTLAAVGLAMITAGPLAAQNLYAPVAKVDDAVVTEFEVQQRQRFLQALNAPGATREGALQSLIDERLRNRAIQQAGITLTPEGITDSLAEDMQQHTRSVCRITLHQLHSIPKHIASLCRHMHNPSKRVALPTRNRHIKSHGGAWVVPIMFRRISDSGLQS